MQDLGLADFLDDYELTTSFTWNGGTYTGAIGAGMKTKALEEGGFSLDADQILVVRSSQFVTKPATKDTITISPNTYRIESITTAPDGSFLVLNLQDSGRGV